VSSNIDGWCPKRSDEAPYAFLSSLYDEHQELRSRIYEIGERVGRFVYVDERVWERDLAVEDPVVIADYLIRKVREAKVFICVLGAKRHGDPIKFSDRDSSVSFLELELFQAALLRKPIQLYVLDGFSPEPMLAGILEVLEFALPRRSIQRPLSESDLETEISRILDEKVDVGIVRLRSFVKKLVPSNLEQQVFRIFEETLNVGTEMLLPRRYSIIRNLVQSLYDTRSANKDPHSRTDIEFLDGHLHSAVGSVDEGLVIDALKAAREQRDEELRLSRAWFAIRELMKCTPNDYRDPQLLSYWNMALDQWAAAAGWYGLHGHLYMGALAAFNSMAKVRETLRNTVRPAEDPNERRYPGGQLASARYSIAKRLYGTARADLLKKALDDANIAIREGEDPLGSTLSVKAAIHRAMGDINLAVQDFEEVLRRREQAGKEAGPMGVALSNLGYAYLYQKRFWRGRELLEEGVRLLENNNSRQGFVARAKNKLAVAYLLTGRPLRAYEEMREAQCIARDCGAFDQM